MSGQENNGPAGGTTTTSPLPEEKEPGLIFSQGITLENTSDVPIYNPQRVARAAEHSGNLSSGSLR